MVRGLARQAPEEAGLSLVQCHFLCCVHGTYGWVFPFQCGWRWQKSWDVCCAQSHTEWAALGPCHRLAHMFTRTNKTQAACAQGAHLSLRIDGVHPMCPEGFPGEGVQGRGLLPPLLRMLCFRIGQRRAALAASSLGTDASLFVVLGMDRRVS